MANLFTIPKNIVTGEDAIEASMEYMVPYGKKALIVTDEVMVKIGHLEKLTSAMDKAGFEYEVYSGINTEPTHLMIDEGVRIFKETKCEFLIGIGGGSPLDASKAIGAVANNGGSITDYVGKKIENKLPYIVAIPTTAGTGSEATIVSVITNTDTDVKMMLKDVKLIADLAVVDPVLTLTVPPNITVATGLDALVHAIEAYTSLKAFPMTDVYAREAVAKIFDNIYEVYKHGDNMIARREMAIAALEAGIAFSNASVTIVHGMSRPIGAVFHIPHGQSNAMLLGVGLKYLKSGAVKRLSDLAQAIGVFRQGMTNDEGADAFVTATTALLRTLDVPTIQECGIKEEEFFYQIPKMAKDAIASGSPGNTRRVPNQEEIEELYKEFWNEGYRK